MLTRKLQVLREVDQNDDVEEVDEIDEIYEVDDPKLQKNSVFSLQKTHQNMINLADSCRLW